MDARISKCLEMWQKKLLDMGMRNQLLNFKEPKMSSLYVTEPEDKQLFKMLVTDECTLQFPYVERYARINRDEYHNLFELSEEVDEEEVDEPACWEIPGDVKTNKTTPDLQRVLKTLRSRAKTANEEQGVNILYMSFGFLEWTESDASKDIIKSPLILVPVVIEHESITSPYKIRLHEDEIVANPTLAYKLENDFGIILPGFDPALDSLDTFFEAVKRAVQVLGWNVNRRVAISLLSFLKINMYKDLQVRGAKIAENAIVRLLCGIDDAGVSDVPSMDSYDHDEEGKPIRIFQVMDADSSQMDAIELSKRGVSFVLQGPPGTGKSQTITNIIAEALEEGKKVLFVSEKMAALEVVYKRLSAAGLADFCLVLHSHKANKRELLDSLGATLKLQERPISVRADAIMKLRRLEEKRKALNAYCRELHRVIEPLNQSAFDANGIIASLENAPHVEFDLSQIDVLSITEEKLTSLRFVVQDYAKMLGELTESYAENTWKNSTLQSVTFALNHDIKARFEALIERISALSSDVDAYNAELRLDNNLSIRKICEFAEMMRFCSTSKGFPVKWMDAADFEHYEDAAKARRECEAQQAARKEKIDAKFNAGFYLLNVGAITENIESRMSIVCRLMIEQYDDIHTVIEQTEDICALSESVIATIEKENTILEDIAKDFGIHAPKTRTEIPAFCSFLESYGEDFKADRYWFNTGRWTRDFFNEKILLAEGLVGRVRELSERILETYDKEILTFEYKQVLKRFRSEYTSSWRALSGDYRKDNKILRSMQKNTRSKLTYEQTLENLQLLKDYHDTLDELEENEADICHALGQRFAGTNTDFEAIRTAAQKFREVLEYLGNNIPRDVKLEILNGENVGKYSGQMYELQNLLINKNLTRFEEILRKPLKSYTQFTEYANEVMETIRAIDDEISTVFNTAKPETRKTECWDYLLELAQYQQQRQDNARQGQECTEKFEYLFDAEHTDWDDLLERLAWCERFRDYARTYALRSVFVQGIASDEHTRIVSEDYANYLERTYTDAFDDINWLVSLFNRNEEIREKSLSDLKTFVSRCRNNMQGLEAWIDFCNAKAKCEEAGLTDFVTRALDMQMKPETIEGAFLKRFEHVWLDAVMPQIPAVERFRSRNQNELIEEFRELDREQFQIAQTRIRAQLIQRLPSINGLAAGRDEVGILRREMEKQRKIMPVRRLFASIPNLLPRLKPCLMMSPLSVSLFLQDESYQFDMVIFDEASQVRTENAIGAISRGKQVIIAGDIHQLPPTSFFTASVSGDDEFDEEDDTDSFESVLSEARTVLPEEKLKWHYRSRNENLIAFSNHKIYKDTLVTFPSPTEENDSEGVEYIYVPDGLYERSGKRINPIEAKKVVDVIFEQINKHPERSMGVITFSEAQMRCVESELITRRLETPQFEEFFSEGREEAFFIKNLENVQGDERDIIIFSIGYAKANPLEPLKMNFGPLNKSGGYRRLNVAVTRAKYAIKLVGSILPTDMEVNDTTPQGVRLLRDYIDFAKNGPSVLKNEVTYSNKANTESPFEEAVYDYLTGQGFSLATQVGCSGYRIDMAVRHPELYGKFVVGIECDGAMYHSSRTARERDRLRQSVLECMGWKFIRIWSTDWIKDPVTEGRRVVDEINRAIENFGLEPPEQQRKPQRVENYGQATEPTPVLNGNDPRFRQYRKIDVAFYRYGASTPRVAKQLGEIIKELSPIHIKYAYEQLLPMYGRTAVNQAVKDNVNFIIRNYAETFSWRKIDNYLWDETQKKIKPMLPTDDCARKIDMIAKEELAEAMYILISDSVGIDRDSLFIATARLYGFQRTTENMRHSFEEAFSLLEIHGRVKEFNGKLTIDDEE